MWAAAINNNHQKSASDTKIITENMLIEGLIQEKYLTESPGLCSSPYLKPANPSLGIQNPYLMKHCSPKLTGKIEPINMKQILGIPDNKQTSPGFLQNPQMNRKSLFSRKNTYDPMQNDIKISPVFEFKGDKDEPGIPYETTQNAEDSILYNQNTRKIQINYQKAILTNSQSLTNNRDKKDIHNSISIPKNKEDQDYMNSGEGNDYDNNNNTFKTQKYNTKKSENYNFNSADTYDHNDNNPNIDDQETDSIIEDYNTGINNINNSFEDDDEDQNMDTIYQFNEYDSNENDMDDKEKKNRLRTLFYKRARHQNNENRKGLFGLMRALSNIFQKSIKDELPLNNDQINLFNDLSTAVDNHKSLFDFGKTTEFQITLNSASNVTTETLRNSEKLNRPDSYVQKPDSKSHLSWDVLCAGLIVYQMLIIPLRISFSVNDGKGVLDTLDFTMDIIFLLDIIMNFNTGYYSKGKLILQRKQIAFNYVKKWFWIDLIASFPYSWLAGINIIGDGDTVNDLVRSAGLLKVIRLFRFLKILRLIRIFKLKKIFSKLETIINTSPVINAFLGFSKIALIILVIAHWIACIWHYIGTFELDQSPVTWMTSIGINDAEWTERYITSMYWAITTMITVGYGDVTPVTELEMIIVIFIELISSGVFAFSMNSINTLLTNIDSATTSYRQTISAIHRYMKKRQVSPEVQMKVKKYLEYTLDNESSKLDEENLMGLLSENLRQELISEMNGKILSNFKIFIDKFSQRFLIETTLIMKEKIYGADEIIIREDDIEDLSIYFIVSGTVEIFSIESGSLLQTLEKDKCFGELAFFTGMKRIASARSITFSELRCINRDDFLRLLDQFPEDKERFCMIKDQINLYKNYAELNMHCYSCNKRGHIVTECPQIHYEINHFNLIQQYQDTEIKFCKEFKRPNHHIKSLKNDNIQNAGKKIQSVYGDSPLFYININKENNNYYEMCNMPAHINESGDDIISSYGNIDEKATRFQDINDIMKKDHLYNNNNELLSKDLIGGLYSGENLEKNSRNKLTNLNTEQSFILGNKNKAKDNDYNKYFIFDHVYEYKIYFPHNNLKNILNEMKKYSKMNKQETLVLKQHKDSQKQHQLYQQQTNFEPLNDTKTKFLSKYMINQPKIIDSTDEPSDNNTKNNVEKSNEYNNNNKPKKNISTKSIDTRLRLFNILQDDSNDQYNIFNNKKNEDDEISKDKNKDINDLDDYSINQNLKNDADNYTNSNKINKKNIENPVMNEKKISRINGINLLEDTESMNKSNKRLELNEMNEKNTINESNKSNNNKGNNNSTIRDDDANRNKDNDKEANINIDKIIKSLNEENNMRTNSYKDNINIDNNSTFESYIPLLDKIMNECGKELIFELIKQKEITIIDKHL